MRRRIFAAGLLCALLSCRAIAAEDATKAALITEIRQTISTAKTGDTKPKREMAAMHLAALAQKIAPQDVDDETFTEWASLLDSPNEWVRPWAAGSLGMLGPRAKSVLPKLQAQLQALPPTRCGSNLAVTKDSFIRRAIERIKGVKIDPKAAQRRAYDRAVKECAQG